MSPAPRRNWPHAPPHWLFEQGIYLVTGATYHKELFFNTPSRLDLLTDELFFLAEKYCWQLEAWAVMANHYHFVARSSENPENLRSMLSTLHTRTSAAINKSDGKPGRRVWYQFWDTHLTFERSYLVRLAYVHGNPVKHGLVKNARDYKWCSAAWFMENAPKGFAETVRRMKTDKAKVYDDF